MKTKPTFINLLFLIVLTLLVGDSFRNPLTSQNLTGISAHKLIIPYLILQFIINQKYSLYLSTSLIKIINRFLLPASIIITIILSLIDAVTPINFIYSVTNLHQQQIGLISIFLGLSVLLNHDWKWWRHNFPLALKLTPFIGFFTLLTSCLWPNDVFKNMVLEDHLVENLQFLVLIIGSLLSAFIAAKLKNQFHPTFIIFTILAFSFLLIAGDEISWGQRIFKLETNKLISSYNLQNENTIHNLSFFDPFIQIGYLSISFAGLLGRPLSQRIFKKNNSLTKWLPDRLFSGYFLLPLIYHTIDFYSQSHPFKDWSEPIELFLYSGIIFWFILRGFNLICPPKPVKPSHNQTNLNHQSFAKSQIVV